MARFAWLRQLVTTARRSVHARSRVVYRRQCEARIQDTLFPRLDTARLVKELKESGLAFGLKLPPEIVAAISQYAEKTPCYADRQASCGFTLDQRSEAERILGKPILLAQYFNTIEACPEIAKLATDPVLQTIACDYLGSVPTFVGANLWWTFPVDALASDRDRHAHLFHRDVDDFRFFKFFFYLTDVALGDGAHVCVSGSHQRPPKLSFSDRWNIRRYTDQEITGQYHAVDIHEICGTAGEGFAENTLCIHKGRTPTKAPRLLLQLQYALFDYGAMHDRREDSILRMLL
ncbi:hypothetical protein [Pseudomonas zhanjiangensis]